MSTIAPTRGVSRAPYRTALRRGLSRCGLRHQGGQAMIEYIVVLAFSVILLIKPFNYNDVANPGAPATQGSAVKQLADAIKGYHRHYSYAMAIASIPDCDYQFAYDKSSSASEIGALTAGITVGFDRCIDWQNPSVPGLTVSGDLAVTLASNLTNVIQNMITQMITDSIHDFLDPSNLLGDMLQSFNPF
jgi:hypothetical protein